MNYNILDTCMLVLKYHGRLDIIVGILVCLCSNQLQEELYAAHKTITTYARKNLELKSTLQDRDREIEQLRKEVCFLLMFIDCYVVCQVEDLSKYKQLRLCTQGHAIYIM